jgi:hypothetical protein
MGDVLPLRKVPKLVDLAAKFFAPPEAELSATCRLVADTDELAPKAEVGQSTDELGSTAAPSTTSRAVADMDELLPDPTPERPSKLLAPGETGKIKLRHITIDPTDNLARGGEAVEIGPKLKRLAESLKTKQINPVLVRLTPNEAKPYRLVAGFRRCRAAKDVLGWSEIEAKAITGSEQDAAELNWAEGNRQDATTYEVAMGLYHFRQKGHKIDKIIRNLLRPDGAEDLIRIIACCPKELIDIFKHDCSPRTVMALDIIAHIEGSSPSETRQLQLDAWAEARTDEIAVTEPEPPKPRKKQKPYVRKVLSVYEASDVLHRFNTSETWFDPIANRYVPIANEVRAFGEALFRAFLRGARVKFR